MACAHLAKPPRRACAAPGVLLRRVHGHPSCGVSLQQTFGRGWETQVFAHCTPPPVPMQEPTGQRCLLCELSPSGDGEPDIILLFTAQVTDDTIFEKNFYSRVRPYGLCVSMRLPKWASSLFLLGFQVRTEGFPSGKSGFPS